MGQFDEVLAADKVYLERVQMREVLQQLVADAVEKQPANVYEYMCAWAAEKKASSPKPMQKQPEEVHFTEAAVAAVMPRSAGHSSVRVAASRGGSSRPEHLALKRASSLAASTLTAVEHEEPEKETLEGKAL